MVLYNTKTGTREAMPIFTWRLWTADQDGSRLRDAGVVLAALGVDKGHYTENTCFLVLITLKNYFFLEEMVWRTLQPIILLGQTVAVTVRTLG